MPHQCTNCARVFDDGSKEMLSGCPDCGGNKFQFHPSAADVPDEPEPTAEPPDPPTPDSSVARTVGNAAATVRDFVSSDSPPGEPGSGADPAGSPDPADGTAGRPADRSDFEFDREQSDTAEEPAAEPAKPPGEDAAQADARSQVVSPDELPSGADWDAADDPTADGPPSEGRVVGEPTAEKPDLAELRKELNDQFESIKVVKPGQYELNLMELYDREEYIIALQEDGRYTIQVPETWHD